jgi:hypothetical protein
MYCIWLYVYSSIRPRRLGPVHDYASLHVPITFGPLPTRVSLCIRDFARSAAAVFVRLWDLIFVSACGWRCGADEETIGTTEQDGGDDRLLGHLDFSSRPG